MASDPHTACQTCGGTRGHHDDDCQEQRGGYPTVSQERAERSEARVATVIAERDPDFAYVPVSKELLVQLAQGGSDPVVLVGIKPFERVEGAFELTLRRPSRQELQAEIMRRFQT